MESRGVHVGKDGWLFWIGENGRSLGVWSDSLAMRLQRLRWHVHLAHRAARARRLGARFLQLFSVDKLTLYPEFSARSLIDPAKSFARRLANSPHVVDVVGPLEALKREDVPAAFRTDTHYTPAGYIAVYRAVCAALGVVPAAQATERALGAPAPHLFDLGGKMDPPVLETAALPTFPRQAERVEANALTLHGERCGEFLHLGSRKVFANRTEGIDPRRIVVFGDCYTFEPDALGDMLAETFAEVHLLWSPKVDWGYVARVRPDVLICETTERWVRKPFGDDADVDAIAARRVAELTARGAASG